jgi:hypothetical protein
LTATAARLGFAGGLGSTAATIGTSFATRHQAIVFAVIFATASLVMWKVLGVVWRAAGIGDP